MSPQIVPEYDFSDEGLRASRDPGLRALRVYFDLQLKELQQENPSAFNHSVRVGHSAAVMGAQMGFSRRQCENLRLAGKLHDIGKLDIPLWILDVPGKLTPEQFKIVEDHVRFGEARLRHVPPNAPIPQDAVDFFAEIALHHHERADGDGYLKMSIAQTSFASQIMAVADQADAILEYRKYRPKLVSLEEAHAWLTGQRDPNSPYRNGNRDKHSVNDEALSAWEAVRYQLAHENGYMIAGESTPKPDNKDILKNNAMRAAKQRKSGQDYHP